MSLATKHGRSRARSEIAASTMNFGDPILPSAITRLDEDGPVYRGHRATDLAEHATLEEVAGLLWDGPCELAPKLPPPLSAADLTPIHRALLALAPRAGPEPEAAAGAFTAASRVLRLVAEAIAGWQAPVPIHLLLAQSWGLDEEGANLVRRALVLCADHELNVSTFTARAVASSRASLEACALAGLAAMIGRRQGGATARVRTLLAAGIDALPDALDQAGRLPGFGHRLYPHGDPRARSLRAALGPDPYWDAMLAAGERLTGEPPAIDTVLVLLEFRLGLPEGAALSLFAAGRTAGWIAHTLEQQANGLLIRPRAHYVGV